MTMMSVLLKYGKVKKGFVLAGAVVISAFAAFFTKKIFFSVSGPVVVDYWAFGAGILLVGEGLWRIRTSQENTLLISSFRLLRIAMGICIFTIHFLQFVRDGKLGV